VCVCVCVRERERQRERECVSVRVYVAYVYVRVSIINCFFNLLKADLLRPNYSPEHSHSRFHAYLADATPSNV